MIHMITPEDTPTVSLHGNPDPLVHCLIRISVFTDVIQSELGARINAKFDELGISKYNSGGGSQNLYGRVLAWLDDRKTP